MPAKTRQIVEVDATDPAGPCSPCWSARAWTSVMLTAPSAIATATSTSTRPGAGTVNGGTSALTSARAADRTGTGALTTVIVRKNLARHPNDILAAYVAS